MEKVLKSKIAVIVFLLPALLVFLFTVFVPIVWSLYYSFLSWDGISNPEFIGLANFIKMFTNDDVFKDSFIQNLIYLAINVGMQVFLGLLLAIMLTNLIKGRELFKTLYFFPAVISSIAISQLFQKIYSIEPVGLLNFFLRTIGLSSMERPWLSDIKTALISVSIPDGWRFLGLYMIILYSALISISDDIIEASRIDGASGWKLYKFIKFPLIKPILIITIVMVANGSLKGFDVPFTLTKGGPGHFTELVATYMYKTAFSSMQFGYGSAIALFLVIESLVVVTLIRKLARE